MLALVLSVGCLLGGPGSASSMSLAPSNHGPPHEWLLVARGRGGGCIPRSASQVAHSADGGKYL